MAAWNYQSGFADPLAHTTFSLTVKLNPFGQDGHQGKPTLQMCIFFFFLKKKKEERTIQMSWVSGFFWGLLFMDIEIGT